MAADECFEREQLRVDRLDGLEFDVTFQLDGDLGHDHDHGHDNDKHHSHNDNLDGIQWVVSLL